MQAFTTANTAYNNAKDTADADYTAYTQNPSPQALLQFEADVAQYDTALATLQTTLTALNTASTQYVTDLAYEQIYYTQQGDTTVANQIAAIIAATPTSGQWPTELPTLPYLSSTEQTTLTGESSQISAAQTGLLTAFLDYRNIVWKVSTDGITATSQTGEVTAAQYNLDLANAGVAGYDISTCQAAYNAASSTLQATTTQLTTDEGLVAGFRSTLSSQLTAYQTLMTSIEALGATGPTDPTVASIVAFCANWNTNVVQPVQAALTAALGAEESNFATADQAAVAAFYAQFQSSNPQFSTAYLQGIVSSFTSIQSALSAAGLIQGPAISFPALPSASSSMSMSELMGVIGDVEVMTQSLIQQAATSDRSADALRLQFAINHLRLYANELSVLQSWANKLAAAETNYNTTIQAQNAATYSQFVTIYNTYASNISTINSSVIPPINTQIASENAAWTGPCRCVKRN